MIGRINEKNLLIKALYSNRSEFIAVYGRRRVGKTYLVRETLGDKFTFSYSGMANASAKEQIRSFHNSILRHGGKKGPIPTNWIDAFNELAIFLQSSHDTRKVVFIDELPWMDSRKSSFLKSFEQFWNDWASPRKDVVLIVCGSATSWIISNIIKNHGGLHNRLTYSISLKPFTLAECEEYVKELGICNMGRRSVVEAYMVFGGVPYYWSQLNPSLSLAQNIDALFFCRDSLFANEFNDLYASLFRSPDPYIKIIKALAKKKIGMTRKEVAAALNIHENGSLTKYLDELESCGFIRRYNSYSSKTKNSVFQLIDNFTLFYFRFLASGINNDPQYWSKCQTSPEYFNWMGLAFERVCLLHTDAIKRALGISGIITSEYALRLPPQDGMSGAEIDLLIDRSDNAITICEIKYTKGPFTITRSYSDILWNKVARLTASLRTQRSIFVALISPMGITENEYVSSVQNIITLDDLFIR